MRAGLQREARASGVNRSRRAPSPSRPDPGQIRSGRGHHRQRELRRRSMHRATRRRGRGGREARPSSAGRCTPRRSRHQAVDPQGLCLVDQRSRCRGRARSQSTPSIPPLAETERCRSHRPATCSTVETQAASSTASAQRRRVTRSSSSNTHARAAEVRGIRPRNLWHGSAMPRQAVPSRSRGPRRRSRPTALDRSSRNRAAHPCPERSIPPRRDTTRHRRFLEPTSSPAAYGSRTREASREPLQVQARCGPSPSRPIKPRRRIDGSRAKKTVRKPRRPRSSGSERHRLTRLDRCLRG